VIVEIVIFIVVPYILVYTQYKLKGGDQNNLLLKSTAVLKTSMSTMCSEISASASKLNIRNFYF